MKLIRKAFRMKVHPGQEGEYAHRHQPIWEALSGVLKEHGVHNYSIFLDAESCDLFGYVEIENEERWQAISQTEICKKWWSYMKEVMPSNSDNSPVEKGLTEVFHLE